MGRKAMEIKKSILVDIVTNLESAGPLESRQVLFETAAEKYNTAKGVILKIKPGNVAARLLDWNYTFKTPLGHRGRITAVNRARFIQVIVDVEKNGPLANRGVLFEAITKAYNLGTDPLITPAIVSGRVKEWNITLKTPLGKRGKAAGVPMTEAHKKALHEGRRAASSAAIPYKDTEEGKADYEAKCIYYIGKNWQEFIKTNQSRFHGLILRYMDGSKKAGIALECLDCVGDEKPNDTIRNCAKNSCGNYRFRPYKLTVNGKALDDDDTSDIQVEEEATSPV